jgi:hypothetical protein
MVKTTLNLKNGINIEKMSKLRASLKRQNDGYTPKKSRVLTKEQVDRFLNFAPDNKYLMMKELRVPVVAMNWFIWKLMTLKILSQLEPSTSNSTKEPIAPEMIQEPSTTMTYTNINNTSENLPAVAVLILKTSNFS